MRHEKTPIGIEKALSVEEVEKRIQDNLEILKQKKVLRVLIDGAALSGKTTLSENLKNDLNLKELSLGDVYYAIAHYLFEQKLLVEIDSEWQLSADATDEKLSHVLRDFSYVKDGQEIVAHIDRREFPKRAILPITALDPVMDVVGLVQQNFYIEYPRMVMNARDNWSIFDLDFFDNNPGFEKNKLVVYLTADDLELANRHMMMLSKDSEEECILASNKKRRKKFKESFAAVQKRNETDMNKPRGPLLNRADAQFALENGIYDQIIDSTFLNEREVYLRVLEKAVEVTANS